MKFLIIFTIALVAGVHSLTDEQKQKSEGHAKACIKSTGVDPAVVQKMKSGDLSNKDEKTQCFAKCFFEKAGFVDADGNFQEAVAKEKLAKGGDKATTDKLVDACKGVKGANPCETSFKIYGCYIDHKYHPLS